MMFKKAAIAAATVAAGMGALLGAPAAQAQEQFQPLLVYRTGQFAPLGIPWADGKQDYLKLVNARGGINGVKIAFEECETAYDTAKGVECYERLKGRAGGTASFDTQSTGITFAVSDKAPGDKATIVTAGYGLSQSADGRVFEWNFPLLGTYWTGADSMIQDILKKEKGSLKGKKIALVYHDSPYGKEPIPLLEKRAAKEGFELLKLPVTAPGVEQKSTWLQVRQQRPDYVLLWSAGVMTPTALREAQATGYAREKMYGIWWAGSDHDVKDIGAGAKGYNVVTIHNTAEHDKVRGGQGPALRQGPGRGQGRQGTRRHGPYARHGDLHAAGRGHPRGAGKVRQGQGDDLRAGALGPGEPQLDAGAPERAGLRQDPQARQDQLRQPHGHRLVAHRPVGRRSMEGGLRLVPGRQGLDRPPGQGVRREVRQGEEPQGA